MSNSSFQCIEPNPDIAGIGVRSAIYSQALLSIVVSAVFASDGKITDDEYRIMARISLNIVLTACALLVSTIIQAKTIGISLYHVLIILQLSWINSLTFMTVHSVEPDPECLNKMKLNRPPGFFKFLIQILKSKEYHKEHFRSLLKPAALVSSLHFIVVGAIGIWTWHDIRRFGNQPICNQDTILVVLSKTVYVTRGQKIRHVSLALYAVSLLPFGNIDLVGSVLEITRTILFIIMLFIALNLVIIAVCLNTTETRHGPIRTFIASRLSSISTSCLAAFFADDDTSYKSYISELIKRVLTYSAVPGIAMTMIILIIDTELMIHRNSNLVKPGENQWTFGQTLSILLLVLPLRETVAVVCKNFGLFGKASRDTETDQKDAQQAMNQQ